MYLCNAYYMIYAYYSYKLYHLLSQTTRVTYQSTFTFKNNMLAIIWLILQYIAVIFSGIPIYITNNNYCIKNVLQNYTKTEVLTIVKEEEYIGNELLKNIENPSYVANLNNFDINNIPTTKYLLVFLNNLPNNSSGYKNLLKKYMRSNLVFIIRNYKQSRELYQHTSQFNVTKLLVLYTENNNDWKYAFYSPFGVNGCFKNSLPEKTGFCKNGIPFDPFATPKNLTGCELLVGLAGHSFNRMPVIGNIQRNTTGIYERITSFIAEDALGMSVTFYDFSMDTELDLMNVANDISYFNNITLPYFHLIGTFINRFLMFYEMFDLSDIMFFDDFVWVVALPPKLANIKVLAVLFPMSIWLCILGIFVAFVITWYYLSKRGYNDTLSQSFLRFYALTLSICLDGVYDKIYLNILLVFYSTYALIMYSLFQARLSSIICHPGNDKGIDSLSDLAYSDLPVYIWKIMFPTFDMHSEVAAKLDQKLEAINMTYEDQISKVINGKAASILFRITFIENASAVHVIGNDYLMPMEQVFAFNKGLPFLESFNLFIPVLHESGIGGKIRNDYSPISFVSDGEGSTIVLSLANLMPAFLLLAIGLTMAGVIFALEKTYYMVTARKINDGVEE